MNRKRSKMVLFDWRIAIALGLLCFVVFASAESVNSQSPRLYKNPGVCPFKGTPEEACHLLADETTMSYEECMIGVEKQKAGQCNEYFIQNKEVLATTFSCAWKPHDVSTLEVSFFDKEGEIVPSDDKTRRGLSCPTGNKDGLAVILLDTCQNWSVHKPTAEEVPDPVAEPPTWITRRVSSNGIKESPRYLMGVVTQDCCGCGSGYRFVPDLVTNPDAGNSLGNGTTIYKPYNPNN